MATSSATRSESQLQRSMTSLEVVAQHTFCSSGSRMLGILPHLVLLRSKVSHSHTRLPRLANGSRWQPSNAEAWSRMLGTPRMAFLCRPAVGKSLRMLTCQRVSGLNMMRSWVIVWRLWSCSGDLLCTSHSIFHAMASLTSGCWGTMQSCLMSG